MSYFKVWLLSISDLIFGIGVPAVSWFILSCINEQASNHKKICNNNGTSNINPIVIWLHETKQSVI